MRLLYAFYDAVKALGRALALCRGWEFPVAGDRIGPGTDSANALLRCSFGHNNKRQGLLIM